MTHSPLNDTERKAVELARSELVTAESRVYSSVLQTFRWLMATLFAANGGALVALADKKLAVPVSAMAIFAMGLALSLLMGTASTFIRELQDFLRAQKGAYSDACAGFRRNEITIRRQVSRVLKATGRKIDDKGIPSVVTTSVEDPTAPDAIIQTIRLSRDYIEANSRSGSNEQQLCRAIIVFIFTYWEEVTRYACAKALGIEKSELKFPVAGDLRLLRHAILHEHGVLTAAAHRKLEVLGELFTAKSELTFPHAKMHEIFRLLEKHIALFALEKLGVPEPPGGFEEVSQIAFGTGRPPF